MVLKVRRIVLLQLSMALLWTLRAVAQQPAPLAPPDKPLTGLERYRNSRISIYMNDFGELGRYREANAALAPPSAGENRVIVDAVVAFPHVHRARVLADEREHIGGRTDFRHPEVARRVR